MRTGQDLFRILRRLGCPTLGLVRVGLGVRMGFDCAVPSWCPLGSSGGRSFSSDILRQDNWALAPEDTLPHLSYTL